MRCADELERGRNGGSGIRTVIALLARLTRTDLLPLLTRCTQPEAELRMLLEKLCMQLPPQPPPRIGAAQLPIDTNRHPEAITV